MCSSSVCLQILRNTYQIPPTTNSLYITIRQGYVGVNCVLRLHLYTCILDGSSCILLANIGLHVHRAHGCSTAVVLIVEPDLDVFFIISTANEDGRLAPALRHRDRTRDALSVRQRGELVEAIRVSHILRVNLGRGVDDCNDSIGIFFRKQESFVVAPPDVARTTVAPVPVS